MPCSKVGMFKGSICDKEGNIIYGSSTLRDAVHVKQGAYNLLSLTKMVKDGWELYGNTEKMQLKKGGIAITFDIKICTPKGVLFAHYFKRATVNTEVSQEDDHANKNSVISAGQQGVTI